MANSTERITFFLLFVSFSVRATNSARQREVNWPSVSTCHDNRVHALENEEIRSEDDNDLKAAMVAAKRILEICPNDFRSMNVVAGLLGKQQQVGDSITWARKALALNAQYWQAHINLGNMLLTLRDTKGARSHYETARRLAPKSALPVYSLGLLEEEARNAPAALELYTQSVSLEPDFEAGHFNRAAMLANLNRFEEAKKALRRVLELNPKATDARQMLTDIERHEKNRPPASQ